MKITHLGYFCFSLFIFLTEAKDVRQISRLVPVDDWLDFKNRTRDIKPLDKFIGKLRATYDFVFHRAENVSNVGKILGITTTERFDENSLKINLTESHINEENVSGIIDNVPIYEKATTSTSESVIAKQNEKLADNRRLDEASERRMDKLQKLDEAPPLSRLEILNDESTENFDTEILDSTTTPYHSKFHLPYAIAQAFLRWIISICYSTHSSQGHNDALTRESA